MKRNILYYLTHPSNAVQIIFARLSDRYAIEQQWKKCMDYPLNLDNPKTFNEKLQWLKLHDHNPLYHTLVDKFEVKDWVAERIGEEYVPQIYALYNSVEEIDFDALPNSFVLKCTHNSGSFVICKDKATFNRAEALQILQKGMAIKNYYYASREWAYKGVKPRIIAEELLEDDTFEDLVNYKFLCFNGEPKVMYITVKTDDVWENFYDMDFKPLNINHGFRKYRGDIKKPVAFEQMKEIARKLCQGIPHVRVDLYQIKGQLKFSELTFYDWGGFQMFEPKSWDDQIGSWLQLRIDKEK